MRMSVCRVYVFVSCVRWDSWPFLLPPRRSIALARWKRGIAEDYHIEAAYAWWNAKPELIVNSESLDILGTDIDLIADLGIQKHRLGKFDLVLKPREKAPLQISAPADRGRRPTRFPCPRVRVQRPALHDRPAGDDDRRFLDLQFRLFLPSSCISPASSSARLDIKRHQRPRRAR